MTEVFYFRDDESHELYIYGHAGYDEAGKDIVCSAVSSLGWALIGFLENSANDTSDYAHLTDSGRLAISSGSSPEVDAAFKMTLIGLMQIAKKYPDHVRVSIVPHQADDLWEKSMYDLGESP